MKLYVDKKVSVLKGAVCVSSMEISQTMRPNAGTSNFFPQKRNHCSLPLDNSYHVIVTSLKVAGFCKSGKVVALFSNHELWNLWDNLMVAFQI